ncbi:MAG TPA: hypothetical protein VGL89_00270 [Candidatus Koribacter sp.]|jgi:large-conductance mechanosensitive channel
MAGVSEQLRKGRVAAIAIGIIGGSAITAWIEILKSYVAQIVQPAVNWIGIHMSHDYVETATRTPGWKILVVLSGLAIVVLLALWVVTLWIYGGEESEAA